MNANGFYRRPLPASLISFSSSEGRKIFQEALASGGMEGYFALAEQFHTQSEPAYCGLGTLVVVLNALSIDPGRIWKGSWRWYGEEFLDCCKPLSVVKEQGLTFDELACLARCNGARVTAYRHRQSTIERFREAVKEATSSTHEPHMVVSYSRQVLGQTGDGHFSPIAGYHADRDLVLILDVARFKYPPHWVPLTLLWDALGSIDLVTGKSRGYLLLYKGDVPNGTLYRVSLSAQQWPVVARYFTQTLPTVLEKERPNSLAAMIETIFLHLPPEMTSVVSTYPEDILLNLSIEHQEMVQALLAEIQSHALFEIIREILYASRWNDASVIRQWLLQQKYLAEMIAVLLLACPEKLYATLYDDLQIQMRELRKLETLPELMQKEVAKIREQMSALQDFCCAST